MSPSNHFLPAIRTLPTGGLLFPLFPTRKPHKIQEGSREGAQSGLLITSPSQYYSVSEAGLLQVAESLAPRQPEKAVLLLGAELQLQARKVRP